MTWEPSLERCVTAFNLAAICLVTAALLQGRRNMMVDRI
jgi:hypothetical protein